MTTIENRTVAAQAGPRHIGSLREHRLPFRPRAAFFVPRSGRKGRSNMTRKSTDSTALAIDADMAKAMPHAEGIADDDVVRYIADDISRDTDAHARRGGGFGAGSPARGSLHEFRIAALEPQVGRRFVVESSIHPIQSRNAVPTYVPSVLRAKAPTRR